MTTSYYQDHEGHKAHTQYDLGNGRLLQISTWKAANRTLLTSAKVEYPETFNRRQIEFGGVHAYFNQRTACTSPARVTANAVRAQHDVCMQKLPEILKAVREKEYSLKTNYSHDCDGHRATTVYDLENQRQLHITTARLNKTLVTTATVYLVVGESLCMDEESGVYRKYLECSHPSRVTAKSVRAQHVRCLPKLQEILASVQLHYEAKAAAHA